MEVIRLDNVSLMRRTQEEFSYDLKKTLLSVLEGKYRKPIRRKVLDQINLVVSAGEKVGIIGANGSGKSTLLKVICNILEPTIGRVWVRGVIAPLIELGAGFDPEISVLDNIILYGVMLGFSEREMRKRTPEILEFAELEEYASVPVKALSSGMVARLGFAIATDVQPDILILDEVLSVGDESFRNKCKRRIERFWQDNATILLVSHDLDFLQKSCERVVWLDHGQIRMIGEAIEVVQAYAESARVEEEEDIEEIDKEDEDEQEETIEDETFPDSEIEIEEIVEEAIPTGEAFLPASDKTGNVMVDRVFTLNHEKQLIHSINYGETFYVGVEFTVEKPVKNLRLAYEIMNANNQVLFGMTTYNFLPQTGQICDLGQHLILANIPAPFLIPGCYYITGMRVYESEFCHYCVSPYNKKLLAIDVRSNELSNSQWLNDDLIHPPLVVTIEY